MWLYNLSHFDVSPNHSWMFRCIRHDPRSYNLLSLVKNSLQLFWIGVKGFPSWGLFWSQQVGSCTLLLLLLPLLPHLSSALFVSSSQRGSEYSCFDVGFDRFVCCCIHLLCIRELTGRKMKICLRFSAWLFGGKCERTSHAFQIHILLYLKVHLCMLWMAINNVYCEVLTNWKWCAHIC